MLVNLVVQKKMSNGVIISPRDSINKTRKAILRIKNCSPKLRTVLRQKCQERIQNDRLKILNNIRQTTIQCSFRAAFGKIIREEWENIEDDELCEPILDISCPLTDPDNFNLDEELKLEELLEKELLHENEEWLLQQYEEILKEELELSDKVVCPLCCCGFLTLKTINNNNDNNNSKTKCSNCPESFLIQKSLLDLQAVIYECLSWHDKQCDHRIGFINIAKNEHESNLCLICEHCTYLKVVM